MLARLASLQLRLLAAMVGAGLVGLVAAYLALGSIGNSSEHSADAAKARQTAIAIAAQVAAGAPARRFPALQAVLPNDRIIVVRGGRRIFVGPSRRGNELELTATAPFPGGRVIVADHRSETDRSQVLAVITAGSLALLVILAAAAVTTVLLRSVRRPIERAIGAADRVAAGDLGARMGTDMPEEFARLGRAFDGMAERLETADRDQRRFLADVAHEIATPVNTISGFGTALLDGSVSTPAERDEAAALIESETRRLGGLLDDLRTLTRLDLAEGAASESVEADAVCRESAARFAPAARERGIELRVTGEPARIQGDRRLLDSVLDNLLSNALRYTPAGGSIELRSSRTRAEVVLAVRDTGIGIAPEHQARVFDRLYRVDEARDRASGGSGLGLAIAQRAAQALGGWIELSSEPGAGSEFRLVLPRPRRGKRAAAEPGARTEPERS